MSRYRDPQIKVGKNYLHRYNFESKHYVNVANVTLISPPHFLFESQIKTLKTAIDAISTQRINPLNPHDASKHHFATLKNDLISYI